MKPLFSPLSYNRGYSKSRFLTFKEMIMQGNSFLFMLLLATMVVAWNKPEEYVNYIDYTKLDEFVKDHPLVLVHWYATWCSFCKEFAPTWSRVSDIVYEAKNDFEAIKVNLGDDKDLQLKYNIEVFPDFGVYVNGEYQRFGGKKSAGDIIHFAVNHTKEGILRVDNIKEITFLSENSNSLIVGLFDRDSIEEALFKKNVIREDNVLFVIPDESTRDVFVSKKGLQTPTLYALKSFDDYKRKMEVEMTEASMKEFIAINSHPIIYPTKNERYKSFIYSNTYEYMTLLIDDGKIDPELVEKYLQVCESVPDIVCFYVGKNEKNIYSFYERGRPFSFPTMITVRRVRGYFYKYYYPDISTMSVQKLIQYEKDILSKTIKPLMQSQPEPTQDGLVKTVVGTTFEKKVMRNEKNVVVLFYSDFCDHCTKMIKRFEKVARYFAVYDNIEFMTYNSQENDIDVEAIYSRNFHSIFFVRNGELTEYPRSKKAWRAKALTKWVLSMLNSEEKEEDEL